MDIQRIYEEESVLSIQFSLHIILSALSSNLVVILRHQHIRSLSEPLDHHSSHDGDLGVSLAQVTVVPGQI